MTEPVRTVLDCARHLPFDAALAVADSALRAGVPRTDLLLACQRSPRTGRSRAFRVLELASPLAANPFESVLRSASLARDMERYNGFVAEDHRVLRFAWRHAMFGQDHVRAVVSALLRPERRSVGRCATCAAAA